MNNHNKKNILLCLIMTILANPAFAGVDYDAGMNAYNKGQYDFAKVLFAKAIKVNYADVNARYMYCQILVKEKQYDLAKKEYQKIISIAPLSQAGTLSKQGIGMIDDFKKKEQGQTAGNSVSATSANVQPSKQPTVAKSTEPDYLKNAYRGGKKYVRPLGVTRVYIEPNSTWRPLMIQAFKEWESALGSAVMFSFVGVEKDASVVVKFLVHQGGAGIQQGGNCQYKIEGTTLVGSTITIKAFDAKGAPLPKPMIYHTMLHEIGHSIGIMGHSTDPNDIMAQGVSTFLPHLSERDKNTGKLLYKNYGKQPDAAAIQKAKAAELTDIAKRIPNDPSSYIDLGDENMAAKEYERAIANYKKAEALQPNADIYFRMITAYQAMNDTDNEASCYKRILTVDKGNFAALNNLLVIYQQQGRIKEGRVILDTYLQNNPGKINDANIIKLRSAFSDRAIKIIETRKKRFGI